MSQSRRRGCLIVGVGAGLLILFLLLIGSYLVSTYNRLVQMDEDIDGAWAQVENQLKRRSDLIPNLVETVRGYAKHERELFERIAEARSKLAGAATRPEAMEAANQMTGFLGRLLAIAENYPDLKANTSFNRLMDELAGTENRIAVERMRYNEHVKLYNRTIRRFPVNTLAGIYGFEQEVYFEVPEEEQKAPEVKFD